MHVGGDVTLSITGALTVVDGDVRYLAADQIADTSVVTVQTPAAGDPNIFDLNGFSDTIGKLVLNASTKVDTANDASSAFGSLTMLELTITGVNFGNGSYEAADGVVNGVNLANFITGTGSLIVVPEPASLALLAVSGLLLLPRRRA